MTLKSNKKDVTERVIGKIGQGQIELFLENHSIGVLKLPDHFQFELEHHFEALGEKIYQNVTVTEGKDARYTDCDDGGWC